MIFFSDHICIAGLSRTSNPTPKGPSSRVNIHQDDSQAGVRNPVAAPKGSSSRVNQDGSQAGVRNPAADWVPTGLGGHDNGHNTPSPEPKTRSPSPVDGQKTPEQPTKTRSPSPERDPVDGQGKK